jgi:glycine/D-amino acid oxidase-like deaminating enzyme
VVNSYHEYSGTLPPVKSEREWTGITGFWDDGQPFVGNDVEEPRRWVIGGFHGHGMIRIYLCAKALVEGLLAVEGVKWSGQSVCLVGISIVRIASQRAKSKNT